MKRFFGRFFAAIGIFVTVLVLLPIGFAFFSKPKLPTIQPDSILVMNLSDSYSESPSGGGIRVYLEGPQPNFLNLLTSLDVASNDDRIKAIAIFIDDMSLGLAQLDELRQALTSFRKSGKKIYAYALSFGDLSSGLTKYFLASIADKIWLQPFSGLNITGLHIDQPFFGKLLDRYDVNRQVYARTIYKNAYSSFTDKSASDAQTEAMTHLLDQLFTYIASQTESARELRTDLLLDISQSSPMLSDEKTLELGLIDNIKYRDEFITEVLNLTETRIRDTKDMPQDNPQGLFNNPRLISINAYALQLKTPPKQALAKIAVIYGSGPIMPDNDGDSFLGRSMILSAANMEHQFDRALADKATKAIVFRIDSPGGSAVASETIRRLVRIAQDKNIPVFASLGNYAASGGYWIASPCDKIYASALTITGSIGALGGKVSFREFLENIDINVSSFSSGNNGSLWSPLSPYNETQEAFVSEVMDRLYARFIKIVAEGRKLSLDHVSEIAKGRVWTGIDAMKFGLIDELGGLTQTIAGVAQHIGITDLSKIDIVEYPKPQTIEDHLKLLLSGDFMVLSDGIQMAQRIYSDIKLMLSETIQAHTRLTIK